MPKSFSRFHKRSPLVRWLLIGIGAFALPVAVIGIVLPLMPTLRFLLLTAGCWAPASPRWHRWLLSLPKVGSAISRWERKRTISRRAKWTGLAMVTLSMCATAWSVREHDWLPWAMTGIAVIPLLVIAWLPVARDGAECPPNMANALGKPELRRSRIARQQATRFGRGQDIAKTSRLWS